MRHLLFVVALITVPGASSAQWLNYRTPGIPRTSDGKPNLTAPAPRTAAGKPDFTGLWRAGVPFLSPFQPNANDVLPWAKELARQRTEEFYKTRPSYQCLPSGPEGLGLGGLKQMLQTPTVVAILNEDLTYRRVFMDGRPLENAPFPTWMGYSVGHWEGDVLVVESVGFNERTWLNNLGLPHTDQLRVAERYQRRDFGHVRIDVTFTDPAAYTRPQTFTVNMDFVADTEMVEAVCEVGSDTWKGTASEVRQKAVTVAPELLASYVGVFSGPYAGNTRRVEVTRVVDKLFITGLLTPEPVILIPLSDTLFTSAEGLSYRFVTDTQGTVTNVVEVHSSGDYPYGRQAR